MQKERNYFWKSSTVYELNTRKRELLEEEKHLNEENKAKSTFLTDWEEGLANTELEVQRKMTDKGKANLIIRYFIKVFKMVY